MTDYHEKYLKYKSKYLSICGNEHNKSKILNGKGNKIITHGSLKLNDQKINGLESSGSTQVKNLVVETNLNVWGSLKFENLKVHKNSKISGSVSGSNGTFKNLDVSGSLNIENSNINTLNVSGSFMGENVKILDKAEITGSINCIGCTIDKIKVTSNAIFKNSKIKELTIDNTSNSNKKIEIIQTNIEKIIVIGNSLSIYSDKSKVNKIVNGLLKSL